MTMGTLSAGLLIAIALSSSLGVDIERCISPQYLELGKIQVIQCHFREGFYAVAWYDSDELTEDRTLIRQVNGQKQGNGYSAGEYDIQKDGSLVIQNVTLQHEHKFTVLIFRSQHDEPVTFVIEVIVTVRPLVEFPVIELCEEKPVCYTQLRPGSNVTCLVRDVRPAVSLTWVERFAGRDINLTSDTSVIDNDSLFTSFSTTSSTFLYSSFLSLLVCKVNTSQRTFLPQESVLFVENTETDLSSVAPVTTYAEQGYQLKLSCLERKSNSSLVVWKYMKERGDVFTIISCTATFVTNISQIYSDDYELEEVDGSLRLSQTEIKHDGLYQCVFENEDDRGMFVYDVIVFGMLIPAYPVVHGCTPNQYCVLWMQREGSLTCSVAEIRPKVQLEWRTLDESHSHLIKFYDQEVTLSYKGDTYDVQITSKYRIRQTPGNRMTLECRILGPNISAFTSTAKFDILIKNDQPTSTQPNVNHTTKMIAARVKHHYFWMLFLVFIIPVVLSAIFLLRCCLKKGVRPHEHQSMGELPENIPMLSGETQMTSADSDKGKSFSGKKEGFISELKARYEDLFSAIQPIPYIRDRLHCVDKVFVEGGIEYLVKHSKKTETWKPLDSYHDILNDTGLKPSRWILEGEPGYGKSTITLQLAYDWCSDTPSGCMKNTDILIILRLRQYRHDMSIFMAIRQFLLPKDSALTENDIRDILSRSSSVVVVLDGYDEYPDREKDTNSDVYNIIAREMFQLVDVILTTRSSCLPKNYPAVVRRAKLTGFDDAAQKEYIHKAVVGGDTEAVKKTLGELKTNPFFEGLCHVPLLFVMFAHMSYELETFQKCNSVTECFRHMISCFHSHMKNKMKDRNVEQYNLHENDHKKLDKVAFDGLCGKNRQTVWDKSYLLKRLGKEFYNQYVRVGILVEEDVLNISSNLPMSEHIQYKTKVQFHHKLFCEWFAAHHLAECASENNMVFGIWKSNVSNPRPKIHEIRNFLANTDPYDLQYVYRFACGLSSKASEEIVGYLKQSNETQKLAILCLLEQGEMYEKGLKDVEDLCSRDIHLNANDNLFLQMSTILFLKVASSNQIPISSIHLTNCYKRFDMSMGHIQVKSKFTIPVLPTLKKLWIEETGKEILLENIKEILHYSSMCSALKELWFYRCLLPRFIPVESLVDLKSRQCQVFWGTGSRANFSLNLATGVWQRPPMYGSASMTDEDYERVVTLQREEKM
ncbi:NACHT, LRR and PYD domains-containing protein 14 [Holothuria leucospilota]|uniref:NACHT, LRR and PYD domains-containing protein 14 n=1 Tax=Holothuria leucospilota TaxID=206669 RepID=A0A9Q1HGB6_HOLLE|nr:NACHT, LRR and PYD domains-containing protein 14 [Holothuria leucospilota]